MAEICADIKFESAGTRLTVKIDNSPSEQFYEFRRLLIQRIDNFLLVHKNWLRLEKGSDSAVFICATQ
jgi:hypothetical protein